VRRIAVVESRGYRQVHTLELEQDRSVSVGRGWDNDIVVDDEFVDAAHLALREGAAGELLVRDLGTGNGTRLGRGRLSGERACVDGCRLTLGETVITLHDATADIAPATRFDTANSLARRFASPLWALPAALLAAAALFGELWFQSAKELRGADLLEAAAMLGALALLWCLIAGIVGRVVRHRAHLGLHWIALCTIAAGLFIAIAAANLLAFNLDSAAINRLIEPATQAVAVFALCLTFLTLSLRVRLRWRLAGSASLALIPIVFSLAVPAMRDAHERWSPIAYRDVTAQPPGLLFITPGSVDGHFERYGGLFRELEGAANDGKRDAGPMRDDPAAGRARPVSARD